MGCRPGKVKHLNSATFLIVATLSVMLLTPLTAVAYIKSDGVKLTAKDKDGNYVFPDDLFHYLHSWFPLIVLAVVNMGLFARYGGGSTMTLTIIMVALYILGVIWGLVARCSASELLAHGRNPWLTHLIGAPVLIVLAGALALGCLTLTQPEVTSVPGAEHFLTRLQQISRGHL